MGNNVSRDLPRDIRPLLDIEDEILRGKALKAYQGITLNGRDLCEIEDFKKIIESGEFRKIILQGFDKNTSDSDRQALLHTFIEHKADVWTFSDIISHPQRYSNRLDRILELRSYETLVKDVSDIRSILKVNKIRCLVLQQSGVNADVLGKLFPAAFNVRVLDVSYNPMGIEEATIIGGVLSEKSLSELHLRYCGFSGEATDAISSGLNPGQCVDRLDMSGNEIGEKTVEYFDRQIRARTLKHLFLEKCKYMENSVHRILKNKKPKLLPKKMVYNVFATVIYMVREEFSGEPRPRSDVCRRRPREGRAICEQAESIIEVTKAPNQATPPQSRHGHVTRASAEARATNRPASRRRRYDISGYMEGNQLLVVIDKESSYSHHYTIRGREILRKKPILLSEKSVHSVALNCPEHPGNVMTTPKRLDEDELRRKDSFAFRFVIQEPSNLQHLTVVLNISDANGEELVSEIIELTCPFSAEGQNPVGGINIQNNHGPVQGGNVNAQNIRSHVGNLENRESELNIGREAQQQQEEQAENGQEA